MPFPSFLVLNLKWEVPALGEIRPSLAELEIGPPPSTVYVFF